MRSAAIAVAAGCALSFAAGAQDYQVPRMLKSLDKGSWKVEVLERSDAQPGQAMPVMTMCTDTLLKQMQERQAAAKKDGSCKHRLLKDGASEAVMETTCKETTVTTTLRKESAGSVVADVKSAGRRSMTMKIRYTHVGPCREGQSTLTMDPNSEQCRKIRASVAQMDPVKSCAGAGAQREQCESVTRQHIARAKAMCGG